MNLVWEGIQLLFDEPAVRTSVELQIPGLRCGRWRVFRAESQFDEFEEEAIPSADAAWRYLAVQTLRGRPMDSYCHVHRRSRHPDPCPPAVQRMLMSSNRLQVEVFLLVNSHGNNARVRLDTVPNEDWQLTVWGHEPRRSPGICRLRALPVDWGLAGHTRWMVRLHSAGNGKYELAQPKLDQIDLARLMNEQPEDMRSFIRSVESHAVT